MCQVPVERETHQRTCFTGFSGRVNTFPPSRKRIHFAKKFEGGLAQGNHDCHAMPEIRDPTQINPRISTPPRTSWGNLYRHSRLLLFAS